MARILSKMIDMAMSPAERVKDIMPPMSGYMGDSPSEPIYPYGLCLSLNDDEIAKLGLDDDAEVGDMLEMKILCKITSVSKNATTGGERNRIELQITHIEDDEEEEAAEARNPAKTLYKDKG